MTERERFCAAMKKRGYEVDNLGLMTFLRSEDYTAIWFFREDGTRDTSKKVSWYLDAPKRAAHNF